MQRREFIAGLGGAAASAASGHAQQPTVPVIGYLSGNTEGASRSFAAAFRQGLGEQGYIAGRNVEILYRWAETQYDQLPALATDLVRRRAALIVATPPTTSALAAKSMTTTIPIVFVVGADPVASGLVASLNPQPSKRQPHRRELLHQCAAGKAS